MEMMELKILVAQVEKSLRILGRIASALQSEAERIAPPFAPYLACYSDGDILLMQSKKQEDESRAHGGQFRPIRLLPSARRYLIAHPEALALSIEEVSSPPEGAD